MGNRALTDAFGTPIPDWAVWAHYEQVDVSSYSGSGSRLVEAYIPGSLLAEPVRGGVYREAGNRDVSINEAVQRG